MPGKSKARKGGKKKKQSRKAAAGDAADGPDAAGLGRAGRQESAAEARKRNPKAFVFSSRGKAKVQKLRRAEREQRRLHVPTVERAPAEPPPFVVLVQGPPGVGKTTLIRCMVKHYTRQNVSEPRGPITVIAGKARRLTFVECPQDLHGMVDASKYADLVLLLVDAAFGFEMETFEFLNLLQVAGFPKVMGVLTHLDAFRDADRLKKAKKALKHRFWAEVYQGAKLFYLSALRNGRYLQREVLNLARFIAVTKFRPLAWRLAHPFLLADRFEDVTPEEQVQADARCDRSVALFGYARGTALKPGARVHLAGVGDFTVEEMDALPDPCPLPSTLKKRGLNEKERLLYAPMADVGGLLYDKDAVYISLPDWKVNFSGARPTQTEGEAMVRSLAAGHEVDRQLDAARIRLFSGAQPLAGAAADGGRPQPGDSLADADQSDLEEGAGGSAEPRGPDMRVRRRAFFGDEAAGEAFSGGESSDGKGDDAGAEEEAEERGASSSETDDSEGLGRAARWKRDLLAGAAARLGAREPDLQALVYGAGADEEAGGSESDSDGDLFRPRRPADAGPAAGDVNAADAPDSSRPPDDPARLRAWGDAEAREALRDRFVTGDWEQGAARDAAEPAPDASDSDADVFGDFEDVETGARFGADGDAATAAALRAIADERRARGDEKAAKKAAFDSEYDVGGSQAVRDRP